MAVRLPVATVLWLLFSGIVSAAHAGEAVATVHKVTGEGVGEELGKVRFEDSRFGLLVRPELRGLTAGLHAAHVHEHANCGPSKTDGKIIPAGAAGGHYDPANTGRHEGPYGNGHLGDLPNLYAEQDGTASVPVLVPRLTVEDVRGRALMLHAGVDRYAGHIHQSGGKGGMRMYCGVIE